MHLPVRRKMPAPAENGRYAWWEYGKEGEPFMKGVGAGKALVICACLVAAVAIVYGQTLGFGFVGYDDSLFVAQQPHVSEGLTWSGVDGAFTKGPAGDWCPLSMISHMLDCQVFGLRPWGHHLSNLLLHAATSCGLFLVLWRMTGQRAGLDATNLRAVPTAAQASGVRAAPAGPSATCWPSAFVAAVFAVHPLHVESVAWIAERRDVLSGLFFVLTLGAYSFYVDRPSLSRYLAVALLLALGLMAKSMLVTLPALLLLLDIWPLERCGLGWRRLVVEKLPLVGLSLVATGVAISSHRLRAPNPVLTVAERFANAVVSYVAYLGQLLVAVDLSIFYSYPAVGWPAWQVAAAIVLLLAITAAAVITRRSYPYFFVGWFWYVGMLLPVVQIIPFGAHARADRYTYLAQIGLTIALVWGAMRLTAAWPARRWILPIGSAAILAGLVVCAFRQAGVWRGPVTLWQQALACDPESVMAHYQLGLALTDVDPTASKAEFLHVLTLPSGDRDFYFGSRFHACVQLGYQAAHHGNVPEGQAWLERAVAIYADDPRPHVVLGRLLVDQGKFSEAAAHFQKWVELEPNSPNARESLFIARKGRSPRQSCH